jgi:hypothetical protein
MWGDLPLLYPRLSEEWHRMFPFIIDDQASISIGQLLILEDYSPNCVWK